MRLSEVVIMAIRAPNAIISDMASYTLMGITPLSIEEFCQTALTGR